MKTTLKFLVSAAFISAAVLIACNKDALTGNASNYTSGSSAGQAKAATNLVNPWDYRGVEHNEALLKLDASFENPNCATDEENAAVLFADLPEDHRHAIVEMLHGLYERLGDDPIATFPALLADAETGEEAIAYCMQSVEGIYAFEAESDITGLTSYISEREEEAASADFSERDYEITMTFLAVAKHSAQYWYAAAHDANHPRHLPCEESGEGDAKGWLGKILHDIGGFIDQLFGHENCSCTPSTYAAQASAPYKWK